MKIFFLALFVIFAGLSLKASAQVSDKAYHMTIDASTCEKIRSWDDDCKSPYSGLLDVTIQIDQIPSSVTFYPQGSLESVGDVDIPSQMKSECVYKYSSPVARATLTVKTPEGKLIASSQQNLMVNYETAVPVDDLTNTSCTNPPKSKFSSALILNPHIVTQVRGAMVLDIQLSPMQLDTAVQTIDEVSGARGILGLTLAPSDSVIWRIYPANSNALTSYSNMARGQVKLMQ